MQLSPIDMILLGAVAVLAGIGLFRGLSGELASLAGFAVAAAVGFFAYDFAHLAVRSFGFNKGDALELAAAGVVDLVFALLAFGIVRWSVNKFVSCLVPQPTNALLGALSGVVKGCLLLVLLTGVGFMAPGTYSTGWIATRSSIVHEIASFADSYFGGVPSTDADSTGGDDSGEEVGDWENPL